MAQPILNRPVIIISFLVLILLGVVSYQMMQREAPPVTIPEAKDTVTATEESAPIQVSDLKLLPGEKAVERYGEWYITTTEEDYSTLSVKRKKDGSIVSTMEGIEFIIKRIDLNGDKKSELLINAFTGGAHCCDEYMVVYGDEANPRVSGIISTNDIPFDIRDLNGDGIKELITANTNLAYEFTSFAASQFPVVIYHFRDGKFTVVTQQFPEALQNDYNEYKALYEAMIQSGYPDCVSPEMGDLKAVIAAMLTDTILLKGRDAAFKEGKTMFRCPGYEKFFWIVEKSVI